MTRALHSPWQRHVPRIDLSHTHWLTDSGSLTQKLKKHCQHFSVQRINQRSAPLALAEIAQMQRSRGRSVLQRQVLLICNGVPAVFAHTVTPIERVSRDWPFFNQLGNRALGVALFSNPLIRRVSFEYTRLRAQDALYQMAQKALNQHSFNITLPPHLWARRCVFIHTRHTNSRMMVTEVMLPSIYTLQPTP